RSEEHTSELQSLTNLVCRLLLEKKADDKNGFSQLLASHFLDRDAHDVRVTPLPALSRCRRLEVGKLPASRLIFPFFFFNDTATTEIYTLSLHDALPILTPTRSSRRSSRAPGWFTSIMTR